MWSKALYDHSFGYASPQDLTCSAASEAAPSELVCPQPPLSLSQKQRDWCSAPDATSPRLCLSARAFVIGNGKLLWGNLWGDKSARWVPPCTLLHATSRLDRAVKPARAERAGGCRCGTRLFIFITEKGEVPCLVLFPAPPGSCCGVVC